MSAATLTKAVPVFVAVMVWLVRLLIIGTFSLAGDRLFTTAQVSQSQQYQKPQQQQYQAPRPTYNNTQQQRPASSYSASAQSQRQSVNQPVNQPILRPASQINRPANAPTATTNFRPAPKPVSSQQSSFIPPEPTYHPVMEARSSESSSERRYDA